MGDRHLDKGAIEEESSEETGESDHWESGIVGNSPLIRRALSLARVAAPLEAPVLIQGETGTGKELLARFIHHKSARNGRKLVSHNCVATPDGLLESELFGHRRGAFTGACYERKGLLEEADGGTLFLDELGDASLGFQARLLRVLQDGRFRRVGENSVRRSDFRVIAATNKDLATCVSHGTFREDLYYRLNVFCIYISPLRERPEDIEPLLRHLARKHKGTDVEVDGEVLDVLKQYDWPGNVRELENEVVRMVAVANGEVVSPAHLSARVRVGKGTGGFERASAGARAKTLRDVAAEVEKSVVAEALARYGGNRTRAARSLGLSRQGLTKKMKRLGLSS
jgi:two-component system response regulator HupR/HoxA